MSYIDTLIQRENITQEESRDVLRIAKEQYNDSIDLALIDSFHLSNDVVRDAKSEFYGLPQKAIDQSNTQVGFDVLRFIPEDTSNLYNIVPLALKDKVLEVGAVNPNDNQIGDVLRFITSKHNIAFKIFTITQKDFDLISKNYNSTGSQVDNALDDFSDEQDGEQNLDEVLAQADKFSKEIEGEDSTNNPDTIVEEAPIIKMVGVMLKHAVEGNASDIHVEHMGNKLQVRYRVDGELHTSLTLPVKVYSGIVARIKILAKLRLDEKRKPQDGGFSARFDGRKIDFRVSTMPSYHGEKVVMRILDAEKGLKPVSELNFNPRHESMVRDAITAPNGLILITGPTGSGKSTTLYSFLNEVDKEHQNVLSLEDPIEYQMPGVSQSQVHSEIGYSFSSGLRSILRQDPDVIMVGEIRDKETAQLAIQASLTGHLVFSTLHTNSAIGVIPRLIDMGIDPYLIAPTLRLCVAQRLLRTLCPDSKKAVPIDASMGKMLDAEFESLPLEYKNDIKIGNTMYEAGSSSLCPSGTKGRTAVFEMYEIDRELQETILTKPTENAIFDIVRKQGMITMKEDALVKCSEGIVPLSEVYRL
jgi:type IV pilus assembly protein PilB